MKNRSRSAVGNCGCHKFARSSRAGRQGRQHCAPGSCCMTYAGTFMLLIGKRPDFMSLSLATQDLVSYALTSSVVLSNWVSLLAEWTPYDYLDCHSRALKSLLPSCHAFLLPSPFSNNRACPFHAHWQPHSCMCLACLPIGTIGTLFVDPLCLPYNRTGPPFQVRPGLIPSKSTIWHCPALLTSLL